MEASVPLPIFTSLSAVLLVDDLFEAELGDGSVEFHADCLAQGLSGDLFEIGIYHCEKSLDKIAALRRLLQPGSLVEVRDEAVDYCGGTWRLMGPVLHPSAGDLAAARAEFARSRSRQEKVEEESPAPDCVRGRVVECRSAATKSAGPMAWTHIETANGIVESLLFPEVFRAYAEVLQSDAELLLTGQFDPEFERGPLLIVHAVRPLTSPPSPAC